MSKDPKQRVQTPLKKGTASQKLRGPQLELLRMPNLHPQWAKTFNFDGYTSVSNCLKNQRTW